MALDSTVACVDPQPASQLRMKPLHNYTDYELMLHLQQNGSATSRPRWLRNDRKDEITPAGIVTDERRVGKLFGKL